MDRTETMFFVRVLRPKMLKDESITTDWFLKPVKEVKKGEICKCEHCDSEVILHQGQNNRWHAKHKNSDEAARCPGGVVGKEHQRAFAKLKIEASV